MNNQTQDYIVLKPISEKFKDVAASITDDEIKYIIKEELRKQIENQVELGRTISKWVDDWLEDTNNCDFVMNCIKNSIEDKFKTR